MDAKITVLVSEELRRRAKAAAALRGVTLSEVVRQALEELVEQSGLGPGDDEPSSEQEPANR